MHTDHPPQESRRVKRGDRVVILPPDGHGDTWAGSAR